MIWESILLWIITKIVAQERDGSVDFLPNDHPWNILQMGHKFDDQFLNIRNQISKFSYLLLGKTTLWILLPTKDC